MNISKMKIGITSLVIGMVVGMATADEITDLQLRLEAAEARIAELSANTDSNWLEDQRAEEIRNLVHDVLADADSRANLQGNGSPVTVNVHGFMQFRWTYNHNATVGVDNTHGFSIPHTRLEISGDLYDWNYKVSGQWNDGGAFTMMDAYGEWNGFRFGQFKSPFMKEILTAQNNTLAVDRSIIAQEFGQGRSQGVQYTYGFGNDLTFTGAYTDGFNTANGAGVVNGYAATGRLDYDGEWFNLGFAASHNNLDTVDFNTWTVDASTEWNDFEIGGSYVKQAGDGSGENWGTTLYAAYNMGKWQPFVQYEKGHLEGVATDLSVATIGVNYSVNNNVKWTTDFGKSFNSIDAGWNLGTTGWNATASENEYLIRTQITVSF
tara:strand:- start:1069 stop:2202 length:1134 start_codon:yes stop_codon:yes gene_type:complete